MKNWDGLVEKLAAIDKARGISAQTIKNRERELYKWGIWLKQRKPRPKISEIDIHLIHTYIKRRSAFNSKSSTCGVIGSMRLMGDLLVEEGHWIQNPLRWISGPKLNNRSKIPKNYHRSDLKKIFEESFNSYYPYFRALYPAVISLFYSTGIRKSELLNLNLKDWDREKSLLKVHGKKTGQDRMVPVPEVAWKCLENYLAVRANLLLENNVLSDALFINRKCTRVNGTQLLVQFKRIAKRANVEKATIHMFRHSCATGLIKEGVPMPQVQKILGHQSSSTTFRYLNIASPDRDKAMKIHPINKILAQLKEEKNDAY